MSKMYKLYGVEGSYYAAKTRTQLIQKNIPFKEIVSDRDAYEKEIIPRVGYPIVPIVVTPENETLQDTCDIFDALEERHPEPPMIPSNTLLTVAAYILELYADEWIKIPALHYRWYYDYEFASIMMGKNNDPEASTAEQRRVGKKIAARFKDWPKHLGATDQTKDAVEANFLELLNLLEEHFCMHSFALGEHATLADCALMGPLYAHLYRDPHSGKILRWKAPGVCRWVERMRQPGQTPHVPLTTTTVSQTMVSVLKHLTKDCVPTLVDAIPLIQEWLAKNRDAEIPRYVGSHSFVIGRGKPYESAGNRSLHPFEQWKVQRVQNVLKNMAASQIDECENFIRIIGASDLFGIDITTPVKREHFRLIKAL